MNGNISSDLRKEVESELGEHLSFTELDKGLNTIYKVSEGEESFIVKIHTNPENKIGWFKAEPRIYDLVSKNSEIPSPEVLYTDFSEEKYDNAFYIMEEMPGQNPDKIKDELQQSDLEQILKRYGKMLGRIHEITQFDSYGLLVSESGELAVDESADKWPWSFEGTMNSWKSRIEEGWKNPPEIKMLDKDEINRFLPDDPGSALAHSDNRLDNLLIEGSEITAFLDWSHPRAGSAEYDLVRAEYLLIDWDLSFREGELNQKVLRKKLYQGYTSETDFEKDEEFADRRQLYRYAVTFWLAAGFANWGQSLEDQDHKKMRKNIIQRIKAEQPKEFLKTD